MLGDHEKQRLRNELRELNKRDAAFEQDRAVKNKKVNNPVFRYTHIGLEFIAAILVLLYFGRYLDSLWGTEPWLLIAGVILGFTGGMIRLVRIANKLGKED